MRAVVQRVRSACIRIRSAPLPGAVGRGDRDLREASTQVQEAQDVQMGAGLLCLVAVGRADAAEQARELARKLVHLRIFADDDGRMNRSLLDLGGTLGVVSQFTLFADTRRGRRPYFGAAAAPEEAEPLLEVLVEAARDEGAEVVTGRFGAEMDVELVNSGPVTVWIDTEASS